MMDVTLLYAIVAGGTVVLLLLYRTAVFLVPLISTWIVLLYRATIFLLRVLSILLQRYLLLPLVLKRHRLVGPWSRAQVILQLVYFAGNITCCSFKVPSAHEASIRAGHLSMINIIPVYFGFHLSFICDILGISLASCRVFHASTGIMSFVLALLHVLIDIIEKSATHKKESWDLYGVIALASVAAIIFLPACLAVVPLYEVFLRFHQALGIAALFGIWKHLPSQIRLPRACLLASCSTFAITTGFECLIMLYRNFNLQGRCSRALIARQNSAVRMTIFTTRPWKIRAGQYVNVYMPFVSSWSFLQSHTFMVVSWSEGRETRLDFLIEPRNGFTRKLFDIAEEYQKEEYYNEEHHEEEYHKEEHQKEEHQKQEYQKQEYQKQEYQKQEYDKQDYQKQESTLTVQQVGTRSTKIFGFARNFSRKPRLLDFRIALCSGPHGLTTEFGDYDMVLMIATGYGMAAQLPVLKELVRSFNYSKVRTRYIHIVWQLQCLGDENPASELLDRALEEDTADHGYLIHISVFFKQGRLDPSPQYIGSHGRVAYYNGQVDLHHFVNSHLGPRSGTKKEKIWITVSAGEEIRDELRVLVQPLLRNGVKFQELEYQPTNIK